MKTKIFLFTSLMIMLVLLQPALAAKWRVSNVPGVTAHFTTLQAANNSGSVTDGDTVYLEGSSVSYGDATINKKLIIVGPGFFLGANDTTQYCKSSASVGTLTMTAGSQGSIITGISVTNNLFLNTNNLVVKRCWIDAQLAVSASNIIVIQSYIKRLIFWSPSQNNIVKNNYLWENGGYNAIYMASGTNAVVMNNVISSNQVINDATYRNNIAVTSISTANGFITNGTCTVTNNIGASTQYSSYAGNMNSVSMSTVFVCFANCTGYSSDERWKLVSGSPAIGYGYDGVDCGIFGGPEPYILSGIPAFPAIWDMNVDGVTVTVKAKSH